jgi:hypothetical protein
MIFQPKCLDEKLMLSSFAGTVILEYYDYGDSRVLIYCDDHHHKISCGYVITDHNSTPLFTKKSTKDEINRDKGKSSFGVLDLGEVWHEVERA